METERILLRPWRDADAEMLFKYASDPDVGPRAGWSPHKNIEESHEIIQNYFSNDHTWAIELKESNQVVGTIGYMLSGESNIEIGENDAEMKLLVNLKAKLKTEQLSFIVGTSL